MIPRKLPDYVEQGGRQVYRPPYVARSATLSGFVVDGGDKALSALNDLIDRDLNEPAGGDVLYRCASNRLFLTFADIEELTSKDLPDSGFGFVSEKELSIWCLVADLTGVPSGSKPAELLWYLPYVFTTSGQAIAGGREVYGYPKQLAEIDIDNLEAKAWVIKKYGVDAAAELLDVVTVTGAGHRPLDSDPKLPEAGFLFENTLPAKLSILPEARPGGSPRASAAITIAGAPPVPVGDPGGAWRRSPSSVVRAPDLSPRRRDRDPSFLAMIDDPRIVFLKQFRDVECPTKACYQAIVEAGIHVDLPVRDARWLGGRAGAFTVKVHQYDSHPLVSDLFGVTTGDFEPECVGAFTADLSFEIELGREVWRAT